MSQIDVIKEVLNKTADCCKEAIPYLEYVEGISYDVEQMASSIILVEKYTKDLDESVTVLTDVCYALAAIPIVGVVASKVPDVLKPVKVPLKALYNVMIVVSFNSSVVIDS